MSEKIKTYTEVPIAIRKECTPEEIADGVMELQVTSAAGIYIPKQFIESREEWQLEQIKAQTSDGTIELLKDPEHEHYWDAWDEVLQVVFITPDGVKFWLHQDGDLWAVNMTKLETHSDECQEDFWETYTG